MKGSRIVGQVWIRNAEYEHCIITCKFLDIKQIVVHRAVRLK